MEIQVNGNGKCHHFNHTNGHDNKNAIEGKYYTFYLRKI